MGYRNQRCTALVLFLMLTPWFLALAAMSWR